MRTGCRTGLVWALLAGLSFGSSEITHAQTPTATLTGVVRDSTGAGIPDVEITLRQTSYAARTNAKGEFTLANVPVATYRTFIRRLGFQSIEYTWAPDAGEKAKIDIALHRIAQQLDPVKVRAEEDKRYAANASIQGIVVDSAGVPIPEAEVQIVGAKTAGMTRANGGFLFKPLAVGAYVLRVRKLGFSPSIVTVDLHQDDEREIYVRMSPLARELDAVVVNEQSGFGKNQNAWEELEHRRRFVEFDSKILGPDDLRKFGNLTVSGVAAALMGRFPTYRKQAPPQIQHSTRVNTASWDKTVTACVLINGSERTSFPVDYFTADMLDMLEIYPVNTELTGTIGKYFLTPPCAPDGLLKHPTYYVVWLKGAKPK